MAGASGLRIVRTGGNFSIRRVSRVCSREAQVTIEKECARHAVLITVVQLFFSLGFTILSLFVPRSFFLGEYFS